MGEVEFQAVIDFWFGSEACLGKIIESKSSLWWGKSVDSDSEIKQRFESLLLRFSKDELNHWKQSKHGWLALIVLSDQFSRNIYRDSARAFAFDEKALALCLEGIAKGIDTRLNPLQRVFFYLPLEHAESMPMQERSVSLQKQLLESVDASLKGAFQGFYNYALAHRQVIEKFGRYPHRNALLDRQSTEEELRYLAQPGAGF